MLVKGTITITYEITMDTYDQAEAEKRVLAAFGEEFGVDNYDRDSMIVTITNPVTQKEELY